MIAFLALLLAAAPVAKEPAVTQPAAPAAVPVAPEPVAVLGGARWLADEEVSTVAWSPDGTLLASGGAHDKSIVLWDAAKGTRLASLGPKTKPVHLGFSPDGRWLVSTNLSRADVWDVAKRTLVSSVDGGGSVHDAAISADGSKLVTAGLNGLRFWALPAGTALPLAGAVESSGPVALSADARLLAVARTKGGLALWDLASGAAPKQVGKEHAESLLFVGEALLSGEDGALVVLDGRTGKEKARFPGHKGKVYGLAASRDGTRVATSDNEGLARLWDLAAGKALQSIQAGFTLWSVAIAPDGAGLAAAGRSRQIKVWRGPSFEADGGDPVHADGISALAYTPDGATLLSADSSGLFVEWDARTWKVRRRFPALGRPASDLAMKPDGSQALVLGHSDAWRWTPGSTALQAAALPGPGVTWSPDGKLLAVSDSSRIVHLVDPESGAPVRSLGESQEHDGERQNLSSPSSTAFSPDGRQLAVARWDQPVAVWDVATGKQLRTLPGTLNVSWSPDGKRIAVDLGRVSKRMAKLALSVLDAATGETRYTVPFPGATFSPDGKLLAARDEGALLLLDAEDGRPVARLFAAGHVPWSYAFSADGKTLATGGSDATIRIWKVP